MKTIKIFVASSETLKKYREKLTISIASKNKIWNDKGVNLQLVIWEDLSASMQLTRSQDAYNREIKKCHLFVLLVSGRVRKYTYEEFGVAYKLFQNSAKPEILIYLEKDAKEEESLVEFKKELFSKEHFPAFYENYDNLWNQLNTEIDRVLHKINKHSDTLESNLPKKLTSPPIKPVVFMGREGKIADIKKTFWDDGKPVVMLTGDGGLGKTTIASHYYHEYEDDYSHLVWSMAESGITKAIVSLAPKLGLEAVEKEEELVESVLQTIDRLPKPVLMVIDNVDDFDDLNKNYGYLLKTPNIHILITSRLKDFTEFEKLKVTKLSPKKAKELFINHYKRYKAEEEELLDKVLEAVGYNTLVIEILSKNLQQTRRGYNLYMLLGDLLERGIFGISKQRVIAHNYHDLKVAKPHEIVKIMYSISNLSEEELEVLTLFSVLPEITLPFNDIVRFAKKDENELEELLDTLANKAWLSFDDEDSYKINIVIASIIRETIADSIYSTCKPMIDEIKNDLAYEGYEGVVKDYNKGRKSLEYAESFLKFIKQRSYDMAMVMDGVGTFYKSYLSLSTALEYYKEYHKLIKVLYKKHPEMVKYQNILAISYAKLGNIYKIQGEIDKSLACYEEDNKLEKDLYKNYPMSVDYQNNLALSYRGLGDIYKSQGNINKALECYKEGKKLEKELYNSHQMDVDYQNNLAIFYSKLGDIFQIQGNINKAFECYEEDFKLMKELHRNNLESAEYQNGLVISYSKLGDIYKVQCKIDKALNFYNESFKLIKELHKKRPENVSYQNSLAVSYEKLGVIYGELGDYVLSLEYLKNAINLFTNLHKKYQEQILFKSNLSDAYYMISKTYLTFKKCYEAKFFIDLSFIILKELTEDFSDYKEFREKFQEVSEFIEKLDQECQ